MTVDYIILGQGISGTFLSYYLLKAGKNILVIDQPHPSTASKVASGVINPVTGRRMVKTWMIDELLPFAQRAYTEIGAVLSETLIRNCNVLDFHPTLQMRNAFEQRMIEDPKLLRQLPDETQWQQYFRYNYGIGEINPCLLVDLPKLLTGWQQHLQQNERLWHEDFDWEHCRISSDHIIYKHITASKIFCCEGVAGVNNPYFNLLPYAPNKGEALLAHIPGLPPSHIYKQGISLVPWTAADTFWIGSTYEWAYQNLQPSPVFRQRCEEQLRYWLKLPFTIVGHLVSERPANIERRPFAGLHPLYPSVGILNGMGSKGCSLAPYFAHQLADLLLYEKTIEPLADVRRFERVLSR